MAKYFKIINFIQEFLIEESIAMICIVPAIMLFMPGLIGPGLISFLYTASLVAVFFVMIIRPLADLLPGVKWIRPLVILRKGFGVFSASIILSFMMTKLFEMGFGAYFSQYLDPNYWSLEGFKLFAHLGDVTAVPLLISSNNLSKQILGKNWKRLQQLAYVYFYSGAIYEALAFGSVFAIVAIIVVSVLVLSAYIYKLNKETNI